MTRFKIWKKRYGLALVAHIMILGGLSTLIQVILPAHAFASTLTPTITADPGQIRPGGSTTLRVELSLQGASFVFDHDSNPATPEIPIWSASVYVTPQPTSVSGDVQRLGSPQLIEGPQISSGFSRSWSIPGSRDGERYGYKVIIYQYKAATGNYETPVFESDLFRLIIESGGTTACSDGSGCLAYLSADKTQGVIAGEKVTFNLAYWDNSSTHTYRYSLKVSSQAGGEPDVEKCAGDIRNDRTPPIDACFWQTTAGTSGTISGNHRASLEIKEGTYLMAISELAIDVTNGQMPRDTSGDTADRSTPLPILRPPEFNAGDGSTVVDLSSPDVRGADASVLGKIIRFALELIGILSFIGVIVGGFQMLSSAGNSTQREKGKKSIMYSITGFVLATFSYAIIQLVNFILGIMRG
ncbi:MAG: pilin [Patescibacteria group bacterium]|jgi:hypothetical protein